MFKTVVCYYICKGNSHIIQLFRRRLFSMSFYSVRTCEINIKFTSNILCLQCGVHMGAIIIYILLKHFRGHNVFKFQFQEIILA